MSRPLVVAYHGVGELTRSLDPSGLVLAPEKLRRQVGLLRSRGHSFVRQSDYARRLAGGEPLDGLCSLTFDDGTEDNLTVLAPLLAELDVPATVYCCPGLLGEPYPFTEPDAGIRFLTRGELIELASHAQIEIGSHTREHVDMRSADPEQAYAEMAASRQALEDLLGREVTSFAYPNCSYSRHCPPAAERAGYTSAVTCGARGGLTPFELERVSPNPREGRLLFELRVRGHFHRVRELPPARAGRALTRTLRHGGR